MYVLFLFYFLFICHFVIKKQMLCGSSLNHKQPLLLMQTDVHNQKQPATSDFLFSNRL